MKHKKITEAHMREFVKNYGILTDTWINLVLIKIPDPDYS